MVAVVLTFEISCYKSDNTAMAAMLTWTNRCNYLIQSSFRSTKQSWKGEHLTLFISLAKQLKQKAKQSFLFVFVWVCPSHPLTVRRELILLKHGDAQDILVEVFNKELAVKVPLWVQCVADGSRGVALGSHRQLTIRIAFTWRDIAYQKFVFQTKPRSNKERFA